MTVWAIILAAGGGARFGDRKQFAEIDGRSVVHWSLRTAELAGCHTIAVVPADVAERPRPDATITVAGGDTRSASVRAGLAAVPADADLVLVHDAARPAASSELWRSVIAAVRATGHVAVPVIDVVDSMRAADGAVLDRSGYRLVQTPQGFLAAALRAVHAEQPECSDDAGLFDFVVFVTGEPTNLKITHPSDLAVVAAARRVSCKSHS